LTQLTFEGANTRPFWHPDGADVGFLSDRDGERNVYARAWDRSDEPRLLHAAEGTPIFEALWTPDASRLVFESGAAGQNGGDLYHIALHPDSTAVVILDTSAIEAVPDISPNGLWLAYQTDESGQLEVMVQPFPGPGAVIPVSRDGGSTPVWTHDGRGIVYQTPDGSWELAIVRTDPDFTVEDRVRFAGREGFRTTSNTRNFDISLDDRRLLALSVGANAGGSVRDIIVQNFFEVLRERMGN
jgi:Tol biopolymer transport system component